MISIYLGDCLASLSKLPSESVDTIVTSPPYFGLRDYGVDGQIGLEETPAQFIDKLVAVFDECMRVLKKEGTCWVNMGDSYAGSGRGIGDTKTTNKGNTASRHLHSAKVEAKAIGRSWVKPHQGFKQKDLMGMPWRLAFALQDAGWYLRQDIIWSKPNPMPESVQDRCTKAHEYIFLLSKSPKYYFDAFAISEPLAEKTYTTFGTIRQNLGTDDLIKANNYSKTVPVRKPKEWKQPAGWDTSTGEGGHGAFHKEGRRKSKSGNIERRTGADRGCPERTGSNVCGNVPWEGHRANKRSVWEVAPFSFKEAHFATYPPDLIKPCILAGCPVGGTVLDPFFGAGTTGLVADRLERNCIGLELNPEYVEIALRRLREDAGMFSEIEVIGK